MQIKFKGYDINVDKSWNKFFSEAIILELSNIEKSIGNSFTPPVEKMLRFFELNLENMRVCILGQDPYPQPGVATGRAFEVGTAKSWSDKSLNTSLKNILKLLHMNFLSLGKPTKIDIVRQDINKQRFKILPPDKLFEHWESEGILLLNTAFSVETGSVDNSNIHSDIWANFTSMLLEYIYENNSEIKWILWGKNAQKSVEFIPSEKKFSSNHPRLNDYKPGSFLYENHFAKLNYVDWFGTDKLMD